MGASVEEGCQPRHLRQGATTLFAALGLTADAVMAECKPSHRHQEFLSVLRRIDKDVPPDFDVHPIVENN
ncbi:MAG: hypothetical protein RLZZ117_2562 [Cyanobacteriota bacterium]